MAPQTKDNLKIAGYIIGSLLTILGVILWADYGSIQSAQAQTIEKVQTNTVKLENHEQRISSNEREFAFMREQTVLINKKLDATPDLIDKLVRQAVAETREELRGEIRLSKNTNKW